MRSMHLAILASLLAASTLPLRASAEEASASVVSPLSRTAEFPYYTSDPYGLWPGQRFPDDPAGYYERRKSARELAASGQCAAAVDRLEGLVREFPDDSKNWVDLGLCLADVGSVPAAIDALETAIRLGTGPFDGSFAALPAEVMVRIGFLYAQDGDAERAIEWLERALSARYANRPALASSPYAPLLEGDDRFRELAGIAVDEGLSRTERWRYDIDFLRRQTALLHYDPDTLTTAAGLDRFLDTLSAAVPALSDEQIVARLILFMGKLGQGHDLLFPDSGRYGFPVPFSLMLYVFPDGIYVIAAEDQALVGARLDAINDVTADVALHRVAGAIARDNGMSGYWLAPRYLVNPVMLEALGIVDDSEHVSLTVTDRSGRQRSVTPDRSALPATPSSLVPAGGDPPLYLSDLETRYWTQRLPDARALYVQINGISDAPDESFLEFTERLRREARAPAIRHMIVDLRHNIGGNGNLSPHLIRALMEFDLAPDKGRIFVLIGRNTFSSAQALITDLEPLIDMVLAGEPTGSRPNFIGRVGQFRLPYSGLSGFLSSELSQTAFAEDHRVWTAPDIPVGLDSADYFAGRDPVLEAVIDVIASADRPATGR